MIADSKRIRSLLYRLTALHVSLVAAARQDASERVAHALQALKQTADAQALHECRTVVEDLLLNERDLASPVIGEIFDAIETIDIALVDKIGRSKMA